ncbi:MAG: 3-keto-disaccharide hydrolase [Planctomycetota bacterium]
MRASGVLSGVVVVVTVAMLSSCAVVEKMTGSKRVALFDGKTLDGWTVINCEATVDDGDILLVAGNGLVQTEKMYGDFVLEFEWKALRAERWDSGVYFRYDSVPEGKPWPARYQVNLRWDMAGHVGSLKEAQTEGLTKAGQWNQYTLTVQGTKASLVINGTPAWEADGLAGPEKGYIAIQAEVPGGGQYRFRNIYLTELD